MKHAYFQSIERLSCDKSLPLKKVLDELVFNQQGLIPVITQDAKSRSILMLAWMNQTSLERTLNTGYMTYWSRSRHCLWKKGETSGHTQALISMSFDCDGDAILCQVNQQGAACHTGRRGCFYLNVDRDRRLIRFIEPIIE